MSRDLLGASFALATAVAWAVGVLLYKRAGDSWPPMALNMFKNVVALALLLVTVPLLGTDPWPELPWLDVVALLASGAAGIGLADSMFLKALNLLGAGRTALIETIYAPAVVLFGVVFLDEAFAPTDLAGALMVVGGVALVSSRYGGAPSDERALTASDRTLGVALGVLSMIVVALAIVSVKRIVERHDIVWVTTVRVSGGVLALGFVALGSPRLRAELREVFRPQRAWRFALPGAIVGMYLSLLFWTGGFKYTSAGIAAVLNQTSSVIVVVLAAIFLREPLTPGRVAAVLVAFTGSALVLLETG